jgi:hypothetical protein
MLSGDGPQYITFEPRLFILYDLLIEIVMNRISINLWSSVNHSDPSSGFVNSVSLQYRAIFRFAEVVDPTHPPTSVPSGPGPE